MADLYSRLTDKKDKIICGKQDLIDYIHEIYDGEIVCNKEGIIPEKLEIYLPKLKIAFEYVKLFDHSEVGGTDRFYHSDKIDKCQQNGVRLIHILEGEFRERDEIVKSRIRNLLGKSERIFARKCKVGMVPGEISKYFLNKNHIQGNVGSSVQIGLYYKHEIAALMTFGKPRFNKKIEWELIRYVNKCNTTVVGGASKLFKYFLRKYNPNSIVSYSDKRWNTGKLYIKIGMEKVRISAANYWYFKGDQKLFARVKFQKHKLDDLLDTYDPKLTEWENMEKNGWNRIWDCGNKVYEWKKNGQGKI